MTDQNEELPVTTFFEEDQAIGLIVQIDREHGNIKAELLDEVDVSENILTRLLNNALEADLIKEVPIRSDDHPRSNRYQLTDRGKAVQSILRIMRLDDTQREYMACKQELEDAVPDVQAIIEESGLHKQYVQQDFWMRSDFDTEELDRKKLLQELEQEEQNRTESNRTEAREFDEATVDILDDEDEDDLSPKETWGNTGEEEDNEED